MSGKRVMNEEWLGWEGSNGCDGSVQHGTTARNLLNCFHSPSFARSPFKNYLTLSIAPHTHSLSHSLVPPLSLVSPSRLCFFFCTSLSPSPSFFPSPSLSLNLSFLIFVSASVLSLRLPMFLSLCPLSASH
jgi:hypothetical protein